VSFSAPTLTKPLSLLALSGLLSACITLNQEGAPVDCHAPQSSCHQGRFGLTWKIQQDNGKTQSDSLSGAYQWRSGLTQHTDKQQEIAYLEVNSALGPSLGQAKQQGNYYEARAADGRVYIAQDWQSLFDLIFPSELALPADALVTWMKKPNADNLPPLPPHWAWQNTKGRYRIVFVQNNTSGRIDLIPNTPENP
jgi:outer membrane biogenesis lipoprotein LolB